MMEVELSRTLAERLFDARCAENELEAALEDVGVVFERLGWDDYDYSLEIYGVSPDYRLPDEAQKIIYDAGFAKVYVNHTDNWETHYRYDAKDFRSDVGWRVSYRHKRGLDEKEIWVESMPPTWPMSWVEGGKVIIKSISGISTKPEIPKGERT